MAKRTAIHPGEHLRDELEELGLSARAFARLLDIPVNRVTQVLNGQRGISADTALRLARYFGTSAEFWMNLQQIYELRPSGRPAMRSQRACGRLRHSAVYVGCALRDRLAPLPGRGEPGSEWRTAAKRLYEAAACAGS